MAFRREVWNAAGPLNERYLFYCQDLEFCLRARDAGWNIRVVENARVTHVRGATIARDQSLDHDPEKLWPDLLSWGRSYYGRRWASFARIALVAAAWVRIVTRPAHRSAFVRAARRLAHNVS